MRTDEPASNDPEGRILVVDDREENRSLLRYLFGPPEFQVVEAADGAEALVLIEREMPDCVLLDLEMPKLSGLEVLERIAANPRLRDIPVIVLTATDETPETMERALRTGAVDYITKPIALPRVRARVRGAIERRRLLRDVQRLPSWLPPTAVPGLRAHLEEVAMYAELLQYRPEVPEEVRRGYVARIHQACRQMVARAEEFLDGNSPGADVGQIPESWLETPLDVEQLARLFAPGARGGNMTPPDLPRTSTYPHGMAAQGRLDQALRNVLATALEFKATGGRV